MTKFNSKISKREIREYFYKLCASISATKNPEEAAELLKDLLSYQEAEMIAIRLKIAELILSGKTYWEIKERLRVGTSTISRVGEWIRISGEGYKKAIERTSGQKIQEKAYDNYEYESWGKLKKRFPMYYWPQLLVESIVKEANAKQRQRIKNVLNQMEKMKEKNKLYFRLKKLISSQD